MRSSIRAHRSCRCRSSMIEQLGLDLVGPGRPSPARGSVKVGVYGTVRLTIQGRDCPTDVAEVPDECPVLIGQIPLEAIDLVDRHRQDHRI